MSSWSLWSAMSGLIASVSDFFTSFSRNFVLTIFLWRLLIDNLVGDPMNWTTHHCLFDSIFLFWFNYSGSLFAWNQTKFSFEINKMFTGTRWTFSIKKCLLNIHLSPECSATGGIVLGMEGVGSWFQTAHGVYWTEKICTLTMTCNCIMPQTFVNLNEHRVRRNIGLTNFGVDTVCDWFNHYFEAVISLSCNYVLKLLQIFTRRPILLMQIGV